jgi:hypothetical protein
MKLYDRERSVISHITGACFVVLYLWLSIVGLVLLQYASGGAILTSAATDVLMLITAYPVYWATLLIESLSKI